MAHTEATWSEHLLEKRYRMSIRFFFVLEKYRNKSWLKLSRDKTMKYRVLLEFKFTTQHTSTDMWGNWNWKWMHCQEDLDLNLTEAFPYRIWKFSPSLCGFTGSAPVSPTVWKHADYAIQKLHVCLYVCVGRVINWCPDQSRPCLSPNECWDKLWPPWPCTR